MVVNPRLWLPRCAAAVLSLGLILLFGAPIQAASPALTLSQGAAGGDELEFSIDELSALPLVSITTENEFSDGAVTYRGPLMRDVLEHLALDQADQVRVFAANDYFVDIPTSDFRKYNVILALEADGKKLSRRDKGPLWVMYPISDHSELQNPIYVTRLIWQVVKIEAL